MKWRASADSRSGSAASWNRLRVPSGLHSEKWMWPPLPAAPGHGLGDSEAT